ncbi:hypothetical protein C4568_02490 [Candidatus Parcubacteria bacterium]|nr:MAG: hypothetical protein C4568_02490 [Candidatus Parcubacteria bacterium]
MARHLICPVLKSPWPEGRIGPEKYQDFYRVAVQAIEWQKLFGKDADLLVVSTFRRGDFDEADYYAALLDRLGGERIRVIREGVETVGQIGTALCTARLEQARLHLGSTVPHLPRVRWLTRKNVNVHHFAVAGIPRPAEFFTDIILAIAFPVLDALGRREWFLAKTTERRSVGKL